MKRWKLPTSDPRKIGLGDVVAAAAAPVAAVLDAALGTDIKHCKKCRTRREKLNALISVSILSVQP